MHPGWQIEAAVTGTKHSLQPGWRNPVRAGTTAFGGQPAAFC